MQSTNKKPLVKLACLYLLWKGFQTVFDVAPRHWSLNIMWFLFTQKKPPCLYVGWWETVAFCTRQLSTSLKKHNQSIKFRYFALEDGSGGRATLKGKGKGRRKINFELEQRRSRNGTARNKAIIKATLCVIMWGEKVLDTQCSSFRAGSFVH